ncbi:hypothetical protein [Pantoea stewartii]|uniref:hypothetical protein n=1 Tax=Pantoea stewartii TaxID=66269 RepID=UPI0006CFE1D9|nr:hypothetical protein [Pantoea stewartii]
MSFLNLEKATIDELSAVLNEHGVNSEVDDDGDLIVSKDESYSVLKIDDDRIKFFGIVYIEDKYDQDNLKYFIERMNFVGEELRFTIMEKTDKKRNKIFYSTAFIRKGVVDNVYFCSTIDVCFDELVRLKTFIPKIDEALFERAGA